VKKVFFLILLTPLFISCKQESDPVVAEAFHQKLYRSEVVQNIPSGLTSEDSIVFFDKFVEHWLMERVMLNSAQEVLSVQEKNFEKQIKRYKEQLILEAFYHKITKDTSLFNISKAELSHFIGEFKESEPIQKNVVRVNYVKLSKKSVIGDKIKEILFNETLRVTEKNSIIKMCSDSIEYFIDDTQWLLLDYLENDFPFEITDKSQILGSKKQIDISDNQYRYIVVFLDFKNQIAPDETLEEIESTLMMLKQHKKTKYLNHFQDSLYKKALIDGKIIK
jgi:hypothetical protein